MTRSEFISQLSDTLRGEVDSKVLNDNIAYYDGYIREQISAGKSEEEVLELLGDPRLIARTIIETGGGEGSYGGDAGAFGRTEPAGENARTGSGTSSFFGINLSDGSAVTKIVMLFIGLIIALIVLGIIWSLIQALFWPAVVGVVIYLVYKALNKK